MNTIAYKSTTYKSKWTKSKWLMDNDKVKSYVPDTKLFTHANVESMLSKYNTIFFKPTTGSGGAKIVKITKEQEVYTTKHRSTNKQFTSLEELCNWMSTFAGSRSFILQKGIQLAKTNGKPFDIRVMVQQDTSGVWHSTAIFCKVGQPGKVATNYNQGGSIKYIEETLAGAGYTTEQQAETIKKLSELGLMVAKVFTKKNAGFRELGLDVAIDNQTKLWILEVNTRPQIYPLKNMKDKALYNTIVTYAKHYGRKR